MMKLKKPVNYYMHALHRDIGFFVIGLTVIYCISGIMLTYRETKFLKEVKAVERHLSPNLEEQKIGMVLRIRDFKVLKREGDITYFRNGTYNKTTGIANYTAEALPFILEEFNSLHKSSTRNAAHWFAVVYGVLLLFLAISSFWMFRPGTPKFRRGIYIACSGFVVAIILLIL